jgi:hypothetical protein
MWKMTKELNIQWHADSLSDRRLSVQMMAEELNSDRKAGRKSLL